MDLSAAGADKNETLSPPSRHSSKARQGSSIITKAGKGKIAPDHFTEMGHPAPPRIWHAHAQSSPNPACAPASDDTPQNLLPDAAPMNGEMIPSEKKMRLITRACAQPMADRCMVMSFFCYGQHHQRVKC